MAADIESREPVRFAVGDTLLFQRYLADYLPSDGWHIHYEIRGGASAVAEPVNFDSATSGDYHLITVTPEDTNAWIAGDFVLAGYVVKTSTGERHQIYYGQLTLLPNLASEDDSGTVTSHAQRMIPLIEAQLERLAVHELDASDVQSVRLFRVKRETVLEQLKYYKELRVNELQAERVRNGLPSGRMVAPAFRICG